MTTLVSWLSVDQRSPASIYIASDSRLTWGPSEEWDYAAKTFASVTTPDILGYCGTALFPALILPQFIASLDAGLLGPRWRQRRNSLIRLVENSMETVPLNQRSAFTVIYCHREGSGMNAAFRFGLLEYTPGKRVAWSDGGLPSRSQMIYAGGTGSSGVQRHRKRWGASATQGRTSRAEYGAFVDALSEGSDPQSGGAPQLVGLYRIGYGRHFGTSFNGKQYVQGALVTPQVQGAIEWRNELFERVSGPSQSLLEVAQKHARP